MAGFQGLGVGFVMLLFLGNITCTDIVKVSSRPFCPLISLQDSVLGTQDYACPVDEIGSYYISGAIEVQKRKKVKEDDSCCRRSWQFFCPQVKGDEGSLERALYIVHDNAGDYVVLLFYASWCPFSAAVKPTFSILASLFPSIAHFAIEERAVKPSILSKYGVHGFPTIFLINSTLRVRYHGSRTINSLATFYKDVADIDPEPANGIPLDKIGWSLDERKHNTSDVESCPFSWARSPENLFRHETYLTLATAFVLLRLLYIFFPTLHRSTQFAWRRYVMSTRLRNLLAHPSVYLNEAMQVFSHLKEPCKRRSNFQEGAMNAKVWASKSLASVSSFGDASESRALPVS